MSVSTYRSRTKQYNVNDYVVLKNREGYIRYIGKREHHHGTWYGIELVVGQGPNDGSEHGKRYFPCNQRHGIFVRLYAIKRKLDTHGKLPLLPQSKTISEADTISTTSMKTPSPRAAPTRTPTLHRIKPKAHSHNLRVSDRPESTRGSSHKQPNRLSPWPKPRLRRPKSARMSNASNNSVRSTKSSVFISSQRRPPPSPRIERAVTRIRRDTNPSSSDSDDYRILKKREVLLPMDRARSTSNPQQQTSKGKRSKSRQVHVKEKKKRQSKRKSRGKRIRTNSMGKQKDNNRIKAYNKRTSFHRRKSRTLDFGMSSSSQKHIKEFKGHSEETSDDDSEDDIMRHINEKIALPSLKTAHSAGHQGKYTFRVHIKKNRNKSKHEEEKEYRLILPNKEEQIPLRLKERYSFPSSDVNGALSVAVNDDVEHQDDVNDDVEDDIEISDDILFISQNNLNDCDEMNRNMCFEIEESVIEYHVPSMTSMNRNKNIKINIHINNDINNKKEQKHNKSVSAISPSSNISSSVLMKKKMKKKKIKSSKHKHSHHHHKSKRGSKKNCSCHKHKEKKEKEKDKKKKKAKQQIKFRPKLAMKSKTPRNAMPPPPISPRNGNRYKENRSYNDVQRFGWSGLI